jgi:hypothetical protein
MDVNMSGWAKGLEPEKNETWEGFADTFLIAKDTILFG